MNKEGLKLNPQQHMAPMLALDAEDGPSIGSLLVDELQAQGVTIDSPERIIGHDLGLFDLTAATLGGARHAITEN